MIDGLTRRSRATYKHLANFTEISSHPPGKASCSWMEVVFGFCDGRQNVFGIRRFLSFAFNILKVSRAEAEAEEAEKVKLIVLGIGHCAACIVQFKYTFYIVL